MTVISGKFQQKSPRLAPLERVLHSDGHPHPKDLEELMVGIANGSIKLEHPEVRKVVAILYDAGEIPFLEEFFREELETHRDADAGDRTEFERRTETSEPYYEDGDNWNVND